MISQKIPLTLIAETLTDLGYEITYKTHYVIIVKMPGLGYNANMEVDISISRDALYWIVDDNVGNEYRSAYTRHVKLSAILEQVKYRMHKTTTDFDRFNKWVATES